MKKKEYIEREALLERIDDIWDCADLVFEPNDHCCHADDCGSCKWAETKNAIRKIVANFPAADVRPVVLCKDCKHAHMTHDGLCKYCDMMAECGADDALYLPGDWFCADGEKREES